jgi:hypothetical protein
MDQFTQPLPIDHVRFIGIFTKGQDGEIGGMLFQQK